MQPWCNVFLTIPPQKYYNSSKFSFFLLTHLGPLRFCKVKNEIWHGLASTVLIPCSFCGTTNENKTSGEHKSGKRGPLAFDINTRVALGCLHAGIGQTHISNVLSTGNIPTINSSTFKRREREVGKTIETLARASCHDSLSSEKTQILNDGFQPDEDSLVSVHLTWAGRRGTKAIIHILVMQQ